MTRRASLTGISTRAPERGVTQYYAGNLIPFPSRSILPADDPLEPIDLAQARFHETLRFALLLNFTIWGLLALCLWALFF